MVAGSQAPDGSETRRCTPWPLFGDAVGVGARLARDAPVAGEPVERPRVVGVARLVTVGDGTQLLESAEGEFPALDGGGGAAEASRPEAEGAAGEEGRPALPLV